MDSESSSLPEVGNTEDVIRALLDYMLDPVLPFKSSIHDAPSISLQKLVAKQVHAVVLLYNYYHRKCHPSLEYLGFESFCKLAIILKPPLIAHMKLLLRSDYTSLDDVENHISLTERAVMDACDISSSLNAAKDVSVIKGWPVSKVAVLVVDSKRENCMLFDGSITTGVWSVIEKDIHALNETSGKPARKRFIRKLLKEEPGIDEASLEKLVFSAVKEVADINQSDLMVLESHVVYSLSKEKKAARFYIVQCTQPNHKDIDMPLGDVIERSQGALVKKISSGWTVTPAVKYFHLLPYAGILSDCISRGVFSNSLQDKRMEVKYMDVDSPNSKENLHDMDSPNSKENLHDMDSPNSKESLHDMDSPNSKENLHDMDSPNSKENLHDKEVTEIRDTSYESPKRKDIERDQTTYLFNKDVDANSYHVASQAQNEDESDYAGNSSSFCNQSKVEAGLHQSEVKPCSISECKGKEVLCIEDKSCSNFSPEQDQVPSEPNHNFLKSIQDTLASKENELSQTAILRTKREQLSQQLWNLKDEIAVCDRDIQTLQDGEDNHFVLATETVINYSNDICTKKKAEVQDTLNQQESTARKKLREAMLTLANPCKELDDLCCKNSWKLPTYGISPSNGQFVAQVTVKGGDFELTNWSELHGSPREARESVATKTIARLRCMVEPES